MDHELLCQIALSKIPGVGAKLGKQLIAYCGGVRAIFEESKRNLLRIPGVGPSLASEIFAIIPEKVAAHDLDYHQQRGNRIIFCLDKDYPSRLKHFEDAPLLLYAKGTFRPHALRTVAIVGTRIPTHYGRNLTEQLVQGLMPYDVQIISGLAHGIDSIAHRTACQEKIENIAVMGTGMDVIYPACHRSLSQSIVNCGALVSEYPIKMRADKENFPRRNRIIAAMADAVVVIESAKKGGSLITAQFANGYNKDVFAFPGRVGDDKSEGCNLLIQHNLAHLIQCAEDIASIMSWNKKLDEHPIQKNLFYDLDEHEQIVIGFFKDREEVSVDLIHRHIALPISTVSHLLLQLELKGLIMARPGKRYALV